MTNEASTLICQFCYLVECITIETTEAEKLRRQIKRRESVTIPECPLLRAYLFNHHDVTAQWLKQFGLNDSRVPRWLKRYTDQMVDRYQTIGMI